MPAAKDIKLYPYKNLAKIFIFVAFLYTAIRAYFLSITHDEAVTYLIHALGSFSEIFTYALSHKSNNHLLNALLVKICIKIFGVSEFAIRIPALLGHALYLVGIYRLLKLFLKKHHLLLGVSLLVFHPFMLDFFSCGRGYSLALGFLILSLYYLFRRIKEPGSNDINYTLLSLTMLVFSMLSVPFLGVFFSIISIFILLEIKESTVLIKQKKRAMFILSRLFKRILFPATLSIVILAAIYAKGLFELLQAKEFYYGGVAGFWNDTVISLIKGSLYDRAYFDMDMVLLVKWFIIISLIFLFAVLLYRSARGQRFSLIDRYLFCTAALLFISSFNILLWHRFFGIKYPIGRTGIYFIPIFLIFILILREGLGSIKRSFVRPLFNTVFYFISIVFLIHFITSFNFTHYHSWKYDASTKEMMNFIMDINKGRDLKPGSIQMNIDWIFEPGINFYIEKNNLTWMRYVQREDFDSRADYYYFSDRKLVEKHGLKLIKRFKISGSYLATL